jgi:hypothetical protein
MTDLNQNDKELLLRIIKEWEGHETSRSCSRDFDMEDKIERLKNKIEDKHGYGSYPKDAYGRPDPYGSTSYPKENKGTSQRFGW